MKKILLMMVLLFTAFTASVAQKGHLSFMDIPIGGPFAEFRDRLMEKGFVPVPGGGDCYDTYRGSYIFPEVSLAVCTLPVTPP